MARYRHSVCGAGTTGEHYRRRSQYRSTMPKTRTEIACGLDRTNGRVRPCPRRVPPYDPETIALLRSVLTRVPYLSPETSNSHKQISVGRRALLKLAAPGRTRSGDELRASPPRTS